MTYADVLAQARTCIGPYCKACPVCNGLACQNSIPGPGAKGTGTVAVRNYQAWQEIRLNLDTICENRPVDTSFQLFGLQLRYPFLAAPVGTMQLHYGTKYDDKAYNHILVQSCAEHGIAAFTGDGTNPDVFTAASASMKARKHRAKQTAWYHCSRVRFQRVWLSDCSTIMPRIIKTISKGVVLLILLSSKIGYTAGVATCGIIRQALWICAYSITARLFGGDSDHSDLSALVMSWLTLDVFICVNTWTS